MLRIIDQYRFDSVDQFFDTVVQLAHMDAFFVGKSLLNSCPRGNTMLCAADGGGLTIAISTSDFIFGAGALRRDGGLVGTASAAAVAHADYRFALNDFAIEFWFKVDTFGVNNIFDMREAGAGSGPVIFTNTGGTLNYFTSSTRITSAGGVIVGGVWYSVAYCRVSGTGRLFVNGTSVGSWSDTINYNGNNTIHLGSDNANNLHIGFDELRICNGLYGVGAGRHAANYAVDTAAFPDS